MEPKPNNTGSIWQRLFYQACDEPLEDQNQRHPTGSQKTWALFPALPPAYYVTWDKLLLLASLPTFYLLYSVCKVPEPGPLVLGKNIAPCTL